MNAVLVLSALGGLIGGGSYLVGYIIGYKIGRRQGYDEGYMASLSLMPGFHWPYIKKTDNKEAKES